MTEYKSIIVSMAVYKALKEVKYFTRKKSLSSAIEFLIITNKKYKKYMECEKDERTNQKKY